MTKEEILAMETGVELSAAVADALGDSFEHPSFGKLYHHFRKYRDLKAGWEDPPPVSTDISVAWQVVDRMFELGYAMSLLHLSSEFYPEYWYCDFRLKDSNKPPEYEWVDHQPAAQVAICKAALLAIHSGKNI